MRKGSVGHSVGKQTDTLWDRHHCWGIRGFLELWTWMKRRPTLSSHFVSFFVTASLQHALGRWICFRSGRASSASPLRRGPPISTVSSGRHIILVGTKGSFKQAQPSALSPHGSLHNSVYRKETAGYRKKWKSRLILQRVENVQWNKKPGLYGQHHSRDVALHLKWYTVGALLLRAEGTGVRCSKFSVVFLSALRFYLCVFSSWEQEIFRLGIHSFKRNYWHWNIMMRWRPRWYDSFEGNSLLLLISFYRVPSPYPFTTAHTSALGRRTECLQTLHMLWLHCLLCDSVPGPFCQLLSFLSVKWAAPEGCHKDNYCAALPGSHSGFYIRVCC